MDIIRLSGVTEGHIKEVRRALKNYKKYILSTLNKQKSIQYFNKLQRDCSVSYFKKQMYQIKKFLKHYDENWVEKIKLPADPYYTPKRITYEDISKTLNYFRNDMNYKRFRALILLGYKSGLRAEELYKLTLDDIDLDKRIVYIRHNPKNKHSTKTGKSRISFFTNEAQKVLSDYIKDIDDNSTLFPQSTFTKSFRKSPIKVKDLRKAFSQEWTRRQGDTGVKKILGHSLKNDVDLMHYNAQSEEDLKKIYDKVMRDNNIE